MQTRARGAGSRDRQRGDQGRLLCAGRVAAQQLNRHSAKARRRRRRDGQARPDLAARGPPRASQQPEVPRPPLRQAGGSPGTQGAQAAHNRGGEGLSEARRLGSGRAPGPASHLRLEHGGLPGSPQGSHEAAGPTRRRGGAARQPPAAGAVGIHVQHRPGHAHHLLQRRVHEPGPNPLGGAGRHARARGRGQHVPGHRPAAPHLHPRGVRWGAPRPAGRGLRRCPEGLRPRHRGRQRPAAPGARPRRRAGRARARAPARAHRRPRLAVARQRQNHAGRRRPLELPSRHAAAGLRAKPALPPGVVLPRRGRHLGRSRSRAGRRRARTRRRRRVQLPGVQTDQRRNQVPAQTAQAVVRHRLLVRAPGPARRRALHGAGARSRCEPGALAPARVAVPRAQAVGVHRRRHVHAPRRA